MEVNLLIRQTSYYVIYGLTDIAQKRATPSIRKCSTLALGMTSGTKASSNQAYVRLMPFNPGFSAPGAPDLECCGGAGHVCCEAMIPVSSGTDAGELAEQTAL